MINSVEGFGQIHKYSANTLIIIQFSYYQFMQMGFGEGCGTVFPKSKLGRDNSVIFSPEGDSALFDDCFKNLVQRGEN